MYIAMNRFVVPRENAAEFEERWLSRDSRLHELPGFVAFHMLKGSEEDGRILYASHTVWKTEDHFNGWTRSRQFRDSHSGAGEARRLYEGSPRFEGFRAIQCIANEAGVA